MIKLFQPYSSIKNFLNRYTILKIGRLHIRLHKITDVDRSTLYHNHPFHYISFILKGGYTEKCLIDGNVISKTHQPLKLIFRKANVYHRIHSLNGPTTTLFIAYGKKPWSAINMDTDNSNDGLFKRFVKNKEVWAKKKNGIWYIGNQDKSIAENEHRHSIHQI